MIEITRDEMRAAMTGEPGPAAESFERKWSTPNNEGSEFRDFFVGVERLIVDGSIARSIMYEAHCEKEKRAYDLAQAERCQPWGSEYEYEDDGNAGSPSYRRAVYGETPSYDRARGIARNVAAGHSRENAEKIADLVERAHVAESDEEFRAALEEIAARNRGLG